MDSNTYQPDYFYLDEIYISELVFDEGDGLSIFGYLNDRHTHKLVRWNFFSDFSQLTDILLGCGKEGEKLIEVLSKTVLDIVEIPTVVDMIELIDRKLKVNGFVFKVYHPYEKDMDGIWQPINDGWLFIDSIEEKKKFSLEHPSEYISYCNKGALIKSIMDEAVSNLVLDPLQEEFDQLLLTLNKSYIIYMKLQTQGFNKKQARKMSGLNDDFLFKIAELNYKIYNEI